MLQVLHKTPSVIRNLPAYPKRGMVALGYYLFQRKHPSALPSVAQEAAIHTYLEGQESSKHLSFTFALISLSATVARADGTITREEYLAFRDVFPLTGGMCRKIRQLFWLASQSKAPFSQHVQQIKTLFPQQKELFFSLMERLFRIATADQPLTQPESHLLARIARMLGLSPGEYSLLHERYSRPPSAHTVLGVEKRSTRSLIKQRYIALMQRYHPDRFVGSPVSPEVQMLLTLRSSEISQAYKHLSRKAA